MNNDVTVILLTHKSKNLALKYIAPIYNHFNIIIIDNSNDISLENDIKKNFPKVIIRFMPNNGYGAAINFGSRLVQTKYFLISNPDLTGIENDNLLKFVDAANKLEDKFSVLGPRYLNADPKSLRQTIDNNDISEMKFLSGACMFFNKKNFDLIGGFDEKIFLYFEENDLCKRSYKYYKNYQINNVKVLHEAGNSVSIESPEDQLKHDNFRTWHFIWSKFYYYKKHYTYLFASLYFFPILIRILIRVAINKLRNDHKNLNKYKSRLSGLYNSMIGNKSFLRKS